MVNSLHCGSQPCSLSAINDENVSDYAEKFIADEFSAFVRG